MPNISKKKPIYSDAKYLVPQLQKQIIKLQKINAKLEAENFSLKARINALVKQQEEKGPSFNDVIKAAHKNRAS